MSGQGPVVENARSYPFCFAVPDGDEVPEIGSGPLGNTSRSFVWSVLVPGGARPHTTTSEPSAGLNVQSPVS